MTPATADRKPMFTKIQKLTVRTLTPESIAADRLPPIAYTWRAEDGPLGDDPVGEEQGGQDDQHDRQTAGVGPDPNEVHDHGTDEDHAGDEQREGLDRLLVADAGHAGAVGADRVPGAGEGEDEQGEGVVPVAADQAVEEAAGRLLVLARERRQRDVAQHPQRQAAEQQHAGEGHDERRDADVGHPEALPRAYGEAHGQRRDHADPPRIALFDHQDGGDGAGERHHRTDGEVDVAGDDHDDHADCQDQDVGVLQDDVRDVAGGQRHAPGQDREQRDDGHERDVDAALAQVAGEQRADVAGTGAQSGGGGRALLRSLV